MVRLLRSGLFLVILLPALAGPGLAAPPPPFSLDPAAGLPGIKHSSVAWGDYNSDGRLDMVLLGLGQAGAPVVEIYRNTGSGFAAAQAGLPGLSLGSAAWTDYDNDGQLDLLLAGRDSTNLAITRLYRNTGGAFVEANAGLPGVDTSSAAWGDYDNDGRLDLLLSGDNDGPWSWVYRNTGSGFDRVAAGPRHLSLGSAAWVDYDNDGRLDILISGEGSSGSMTLLYRNNTPQANSRPNRPAGLASLVNAGRVTLTWSASADGQTPAAGLSYNLRLGRGPGLADVVSPLACLENCGTSGAGYRQVVAVGNAQSGLAANLGLPPGTYYWSVQALDTAFAGSRFAAEASFTILPPDPAPPQTGPGAGAFSLYLPQLAKDSAE